MQIMAILCDCLIASGAREVIGLFLLHIRVRHLTILSVLPVYRLCPTNCNGAWRVEVFGYNIFSFCLHCTVLL